MHGVAFGKGGGFSCEPSHPLAQGAIESFEVVGGAACLALQQLLLGHNASISIPDVSIAMRLFVRRRNRLPQPSTRRLAATANGKSHDLWTSPDKVDN